MTHSSQPTTSASRGYSSYVPQWQRYNLHQRRYGESQMFPRPQFSGQGPSSPCALRVPPGLLEINSVKRPITSSANPPPGPASATPARPPICLLIKGYQPPVEMRNTEVAGIVDLPPLLEISYANYYVDHESDDSSDLGGAEGKLPIRLKQTEFSLKQFAKRMGQANRSAFNEWKKVWVAGYLEKKHRSIIWRQNCFKTHSRWTPPQGDNG